jgi:hemolysin III
MTDTITAPAKPPRHYPTPAAKCADLCVHIAGLTLALVGGGILLGLAIERGSPGRVASVTIYATAMLAMLGLSTAYNFAKPPWRPLLRRFDHAGIFLMIAGSYTPFTTQVLTGQWALWMTALVWTVAVSGALAKILAPGLDKRFWVGVYLALGWAIVLAIKPLLQSAPWIVLVLLALGGTIYSTGVIFYVSKRLKFHRAIWHGHVVAAAGVHWAAVLVGVVLAGAN